MKLTIYENFPSISVSKVLFIYHNKCNQTLGVFFLFFVEIENDDEKEAGIFTEIDEDEDTQPFEMNDHHIRPSLAIVYLRIQVLPRRYSDDPVL